MKSKLRLLAASLLASAVCGTAFAQLDNFYAEGIAGISSFKISTGKFTNNNFTQTAPATGTTANTVTITGSNFLDPSGITDVSFGANSATFTVVAGGTPAPNFQWQFENADIPGATTPTATIGAPTCS